MKLALLILIAISLPRLLFGQTEWKFPCPTNEIARYTAHRTTEKFRIDGKLDETAWKSAPTSPRFVDILSGQPALHDTRASLLWDDENLYIAFRVEELRLHAKYTNHNDPIYYDNDVEVFIAGRDAYYEFEINAFNTSYEVFFVWDDAYEKSGLAKAPEFARSKLKAFNGVDFKKHPRGGRLGNFDWSFPGQQTAVHLDGTLAGPPELFPGVSTRPVKSGDFIQLFGTGCGATNPHYTQMLCYTTRRRTSTSRRRA